MEHYDAPRIIDALGEKFFVRSLSATPRNLRHIRGSKKFASAWYEVVAAECLRVGIPCPLSAFNFKSSDNLIGNARGEDQEATGQKVNAGAAK